MATTGGILSFEQIKQQIGQGTFSPVYLLMGEEAYFIDALTELIISKALPDDACDFNQTIAYGADSDVQDLMASMRRYPVMAERQLMVIKEAQSLKHIEELEAYIRHIVPTTVLVINYKHGSLDKRKKLYSEIAKRGIVMESPKIYDNTLPNFITSHLRESGIGIDAKATQMLANNIGTNLKRLVNELDKLIPLLTSSQKFITPEMVEQNIGISKEFNNFELLNAVACKDFPKAMRIALYFEKNQKNNPLLVTLSVLFGYFSNLLICYWAADKSESGLMRELGIGPKQAKDYVAGLHNYKALKTMEIISLIRTFDAKGKGVDNSSADGGELLKELLFKIIH